jgi:HK97 gp10 family phage protein
MAANKFDLNIKDGVINKLKTLAPKLEKKYLNKALQQGALIVQKAAQDRARQFDDPKTPAMVWKDIVIRTNTKLGRQNGGVALSVGVLGGASKEYAKTKNNRRSRKAGKTYVTPGNVYYWRFLEFGTSKMKAQPFMRPALQNNVDTASSAITAQINEGIDEIVGG